MIRGNKPKLSEQMKNRLDQPIEIDPELDGNFDIMTSTGSTLGNLAISGGRIRGGGLPGGILVEGFGPSQSGKTAFLCEIAGRIQKKGGQAQFHDPEARLDREYFTIYGVKIKEKDYFKPDTVTQVFKQVRAWTPPNDPNIINGVFADSLAALSTDMEMENEEGDKMGMRRAKEFSEQLRKTCRVLKNKNYLMVCSNQVRVNTDAVGKFSPKFSTPGGMAIAFYASVRLRFNTPEKLYKEVSIAGKPRKRVIGIKVEVEVIKTVDKPYRKFPLIIIFDYGIDDIRANLQFCKEYTKSSVYSVNGESLTNSIETAIKKVEDQSLEKKLRKQTIDLWEEIEAKFASNRKPKRQ